MAALQLPPVALPLQPNDLNVVLPPAPACPPTVRDVLGAVKYRENVDTSNAEGPIVQRCTANDRYNSILYEHNVIAQAAVLAAPHAMIPPWAQGLVQILRTEIQNDLMQFRTEVQNDLMQFRTEVQNEFQQVHGRLDRFQHDMNISVPDLRRLTNKRRGEGVVVQYEIVPLPNGIDPTHPPYNLPGLRSVTQIENLDVQVLARYLDAYGINPLPVGENQVNTVHLQKEVLKAIIGVSIRTCN